MVKTGLDIIAASFPPVLAGVRAGLLCNQASLDRNFRHARDIVAAHLDLRCLFSPQHGFFSEKQDNMVESDHDCDRGGIPVYSLYGESRRPTAAMMNDIDFILIDLQDVGTRVYTFISTVVYCLEAAASAGIKVVILDRPNPVSGRIVEGNVLDPQLSSFVGIFSLPMRHGMTMGELAFLINHQAGIDADLEVIAMQGWQREMFFADTGLDWIFPSPNLPTAAAALVYPGQVIWEGTNVSEGRGTTLPFELFGAPFINPEAILSRLVPEVCRGCVLRPLVFEPVSGKWAGERCRGFQIHVTDPGVFMAWRLSLAVLAAVASSCPEFTLKEPPYEYEFDLLPLDLIIGDRDIRRALLNGADVLALEREWQAGLDDFIVRRQPYLLYQ